MVHCTTWRSIVKFSAKITGAPRLFPLPTPVKNCFFWGAEGRDLANEIDFCQFIFWLVTLSSTFFNNMVFIAFARNNYCNNLPYLPSILASKKPAVFVTQPTCYLHWWMVTKQCKPFRNLCYCSRRKTPNMKLLPQELTQCLKNSDSVGLSHQKQTQERKEEWKSRHWYW